MAASANPVLVALTRPLAPRFMTDAELREHFGLSERALQRLRLTGKFPKRDELVGKTDSKAVHHFFDRRAGLLGGIGRNTC